MVQGISLTPKEKEFIVANKTTMFPSQIARVLSDEFSGENKGLRSPETVKNFIKKETV